MLQLGRWFAGIAVVTALAVSLPVHAAEKGKGKGKGKKSASKAVDALFQLPEGINLTAEQQGKVDAIKKELTPKLTEVVAAANPNAILTPEQMSARREAAKSARESGLKGKELRASVETATKMTPEQKEKYEKAQAALLDWKKEIHAKISAVLTDEQKAQYPSPAAKGKRKAKKNAA